MNWSSGKDAAMALHAALQENALDIAQLITTVNIKYNRVSMHGLHKSLLFAQAKAMDIPLSIINMPESPSMEIYNQTMGKKLMELKALGFTESIFGDIFLEDLRAYREKMLESVGIKAQFPIWKKDSKTLLQNFIKDGFKAIVVCTNAQSLPKSFCGRLVDESFLEDLPDNIDPCGENGEFHTFCFDGPIFKHPVAFKKGELVYKTYPAPKTDDPDAPDAPKEYGFWYCDLMEDTNG